MRRLAPFALFFSIPCATALADGPIVVERTWPEAWPMDPAPITSSVWPRLPPELPAEPPATDAAARVVALLDRVRAEQTETAYQHRTEVRESLGRYRWDCSGMVSWIIHRSARVAARGIGGDRTTARGIFRLIDRAPTDRERRGWQELAHIEDARPGDVFAWLTPAGDPSPHTGHTGFVLERPRRVEGIRDAYAIRIADSIVGPHQEDNRVGDEDGGLGAGIMVFLTDGEGHATHYGWHGTRTAAYTRTRVIFGRLHR
jgi:hypothetical protein